MPVRTMREVSPEEIPVDGGTAVQDNPERPVFRGNGEFDYLCASCANVLVSRMDPAYMNRRVRVKCGRCRTINVAAEVSVQAARRPRAGGPS
jgi:phage FluMu protein Com